MSSNFKNEIDQVFNLVGIKQILIVEGNVDDIYERNGKYINMHNLFNEILGDKGYHKRFKFDKFSGFNRLVNDEGRIDTFKSSDSIELFSRLQEILPNNDELVGVVVDYTNYIFSNDATSEEDQMALTALAKTLKEVNFDITEISKLKSCAIFITKQINQLPPEMYLNNPDAAIITFSKPNRNDRKTFINTVKSKLSNMIDLFEEIETFVDYTEGWTLKEISHFVRYVANQSSPEMFKEIMNNYLYGNNVSPWMELTQDKLSGIDAFLKSKVIGQDYVVDKVVSVIKRAALGLSGIASSELQTKPKGTLFFVGPTGVGKTEMAKAITKFLFGDENNLIRFDMSEYGTENADQKLIGAPPGYVGFEGGGQLTNAVKVKPFSVVLFDEIEKANPKIFDKFLQILEDGRLTDNTGKTVSFSETIIIFTSNIGAAVVNPDDDEESVRRNFISKVQEYFSNELNRPEILGRIGNNIVPFAFIKNAELQNNLSVQKIKQVLKRVEEKYLITFETKFDDKFLKYVLKDADVKRGGRDIINSIEINFIDPLTTFIFENKSKLQAEVTIMVSYTTKLIFEIK
jgi:ATP-dependent Clp protease ATP-binding subunit ClpC